MENTVIIARSLCEALQDLHVKSEVNIEDPELLQETIKALSEMEIRCMAHVDRDKGNYFDLFIVDNELTWEKLWSYVCKDLVVYKQFVGYVGDVVWSV